MWEPHETKSREVESPAMAITMTPHDRKERIV